MRIKLLVPIPFNLIQSIHSRSKLLSGSFSITFKIGTLIATNAIKIKLPTSTFKVKTKSAYAIYLDSLAPTGRKSMKTLLQQCASIRDHEKPIERFDWGTLTLEKAHLIRSIFIEAGYAVNSINFALAGLKSVAKTALNLGANKH